MRDGWVRAKKSRKTSCLPEDCSLQAQKVLRDHVAHYHEHISDARVVYRVVAKPATLVFCVVFNLVEAD